MMIGILHPQEEIWHHKVGRNQREGEGKINKINYLIH